MITTPTNLDYLIQFIRVRVGDITNVPPKYSDDMIRTAMVAAVLELGPRWGYKYLLQPPLYTLYRNPHTVMPFDQADPAIALLDPLDEVGIQVMAAIIIFQGKYLDLSDSFINWRDGEVSYSNASSTSFKTNLDDLMAELDRIYRDPRKRLAQARKQSLPGFSGYENRNSRQQ